VGQTPSRTLIWKDAVGQIIFVVPGESESFGSVVGKIRVRKVT